MRFHTCAFTHALSHMRSSHMLSSHHTTARHGLGRARHATMSPPPSASRPKPPPHHPASCHATLTPGQVTSSQVKSRRVQSSHVTSSQVTSRHVTSSRHCPPSCHDAMSRPVVMDVVPICDVTASGGACRAHGRWSSAAMMNRRMASVRVGRCDLSCQMNASTAEIGHRRRHSQIAS